MNGRKLLLAGLSLTVCGFAAIACSSNNSNNNPGPQDAGHDSTSPPHDASAVDSAPEVDATSNVDTGVGDGGGEPHDAGPDGATCAPFDAAGLDDAAVAAGFEAVWQVYRCFGCHQPSSDVVTDAGAGIVLSGNNAGLGDSGMIFPPNLTSDPATGLGCWSDSQIMNAMLNGVDDQGRTLCKPMPKFSQPMSNPDGSAKPGYPMDASTAQEIVDFLRSLPVVVNQVPDTTCPAGDAGAADAATADAATADAATADAAADAADQ
jgi:hypothetical protein